MIQKIKMTLLAFSAFIITSVPLTLPAVVYAADPDITNSLCSGGDTLKVGTTGGCAAIKEQESTLNPLLAKIINIFSVIVGVLAVIMIIVGGFRYITSGGKEEGIKSAKNSILYALIGLIIVALAQVIVRFVLNKATTT